jgi:hypothetical protein
MYTARVNGRAAIASVFLLAATCLAADPHAFTVGVLRRDGVVIPFAAFDGKHWKAIWSEPAADVEIPIDLRNVPKSWWGPAGPANTWQAVTAAAEPITLHVRQPDLIPAQCLRQIGLRTDYVPPQSPPRLDERPYPKDGLAVAPPIPVGRVDVVGAGAPEWREFVPLITDGFNKAERELSRNEDDIVKKDVREAIQPTIEAIYAFGTDTRIYYVEAARDYWSEPKTNVCLATAFGHMWLIRDHGVVKPVTTVVTEESCDRNEVNYMLPLGVIAAGDRLFWIAQRAGWDREGYQILEINAAKIVMVLGRFGGAC